jgi:hypothetical protein
LCVIDFSPMMCWLRITDFKLNGSVGFAEQRISEFLQFSSIRAPDILVSSHIFVLAFNFYYFHFCSSYVFFCLLSIYCFFYWTMPANKQHQIFLPDSDVVKGNFVQYYAKGSGSFPFHRVITELFGPFCFSNVPLGRKNFTDTLTSRSRISFFDHRIRL